MDHNLTALVIELNDFFVLFLFYEYGDSLDICITSVTYIHMYREHLQASRIKPPPSVHIILLQLGQIIAHGNSTIKGSSDF